MTSKLLELDKGCIVCGAGQLRRRRATTYLSLTCQNTFSQIYLRVLLAEIWQDSPVVDLLLSTVHAAASTSRLELLPNCPSSNLPAIKELINQLPAISTLTSYLHFLLSIHNDTFQLEKALLSYSNNQSSALATGLRWACSSYRGFLVSAIGSQRIPSFGNNQFLLVNACPELEAVFSGHLPTPDCTSQILFHGTTLDRLYAIICQGLQVQSGTALQQHGASYGAGVYVASEPNVAWSYAAAWSGGWKSSQLQNMHVLLGCELAGWLPPSQYTGIYVITDATRSAVRYIFLLDSNTRLPAAKDIILPISSVFQSLRRGTL